MRYGIIRGRRMAMPAILAYSVALLRTEHPLREYLFPLM